MTSVTQKLIIKAQERSNHSTEVIKTIVQFVSRIIQGGDENQEKVSLIIRMCTLLRENRHPSKDEMCDMYHRITGEWPARGLRKRST